MEARTVLKLQLKDGSQAPELKGKEFVGFFFFFISLAHLGCGPNLTPMGRNQDLDLECEIRTARHRSKHGNCTFWQAGTLPPRPALPRSLQGVFPDVDDPGAGSSQVPPDLGRGPAAPGQTHLSPRQHPPHLRLSGLPLPQLLRLALLLTTQAQAFPCQRQWGVDCVPHLFPGVGGTLGEGGLPKLGGWKFIFTCRGLSVLRARGPLLPTCHQEQ